MSNANPAVRAAGAALLLAATLSACGDDDPTSVTLTLLTPSDGQIVTLEDDTDPDEPGVQFDVTGSSSGLRVGTPLELYLDGEAEGSTGDIGADGTVALNDVTLVPGEHRLQLRTAVGFVQSDEEHSYTLRAIVIQEPNDGDELSDQNDEQDGIQITVRTQSFALDFADEVTLRVDDEEVGTASQDIEGSAVFEITLAPGEHTLQARVDSGDDQIVSENIEINARDEEPPPPPPACEGVELLAPSAPGSGAIVLGGNDCDGDDHVTADVRLKIEDSDGMTAELLLNGEPAGSAEVTDGEVEFGNVEFADASGNELTLVVGGEDCSVTTRDIQLDCATPRCVIRAPEPVEVGGTLYLSSQQLTGEGFNVEVETDNEADGEPVALVIDGDDAGALTTTAGEVSGDIVALFEGVELADGPHTISARCRDARGNIATTPEVDVVVDTTPCTVDITAPAEGAIYLPDDDTTPGTDGVQVGGIAGVTGSDCVAARAGLCTGGDLSGDFADFDGESPHTSLFTLADAVISQNYCVEIRDHVGNVASDEVAFMFRQLAPDVEITGPASGTSFNNLGGGAYVGDSLPLTPLCEAELIVACEVGTMVELHHDDADGPLIATAECVEGSATFTDAVISDANGDEATTIVATQTFGGSEDLRGVSDPVTYNTDCEAPVVVETHTPCSLHASHQITDEEAADFIVELGDSSADTETAELSYWIGEGAEAEPLGEPTATQSGTVVNGTEVSFATIDFGELGPLVLAVELEDDFGNTTQYLCESEIVDELPSITVVQWPADGAEYGPGESECDPEGDGEYGIQIEVEIDSAADRTASLTVNGEVIEDELMIAGTTIAYCVPVPDDSENTPPGPSTIHLQVDEIAGNGFDFVERYLSVHTIEITDPVDNELIATADDCDDGAAFGVSVTVEFDEMHDGSAYTVIADAAAVTGTVAEPSDTVCVPVTVGGERTITASIDGTGIEQSVTVNVINDMPMIVSIDSPEDGDAFGVGDQTCVAAGLGTYGVLVQATVDQAANREADILVNGDVVAEDVAIDDDGEIEVCVDVPDDLDNGGDPTTITLNLSNVLGAPMTDTESVEINVDTLEIVDPTEDQLLTAVDDCVMGAGFGYEVEIAVDASHLGAMYSITDGTAASTGVIMDDSITACVALTPGSGIEITASILGTLITESVILDVEDAGPSITAITAPTDNQAFGPGDQTCATAGAGNYGVRVQATVDQTMNRLASVLVNGESAVANATITGNAIDVCVAVPDNLDHMGPTTITVVLEEEPGARSDTQTVTVNVDTLNITAPTVNQRIGLIDDCDDGAGFGVAVSIAVDPSLNGESYVVDGGGVDLAGTVAGATITGCLAVTSSTTAITASITGTLITETVPVTVFTGGAPTVAVTFTRACPATSSASYREDDATLTWGDLGAFENYEGQFATLQLRCAHTGLAMAQTNEAWWTAATPVAIPGTVTVASTSMPLAFRVGEARFCALRASTAAMEQTPASAPVDVTCGFRSSLLFAGTMGMNTAIGLQSAPVGDVNGDGIDDVLVGGSGRAHLFFGRTTDFPGTPSVTFTSASNLGNRVAGLGDVNGDGVSDFAIAHASFDGGAGQVYVFFGRPSSAAWPAAVDLSVTCGADLCLKHAVNDARLGNSLAGIGDFDADGLMDMAIGAYTTTEDVSRMFIVLGGAYETRSCSVPADCLASETCGGGGSCVKGAGQSFWSLDFSLPSGEWTNPPSGTAQARLDGFALESDANNPTLGRGLAGVGTFDSTAGHDMIVQAAGNETTTAKLYFLSGRNDPAGAGIAPLTFADLGFRNAMGEPSGMPFETTKRDTGNILFNAGNVYNVAGGANPGATDLFVKHTAEHHFYIYPGDNNFAPANRIRMDGPNLSDLGISLTRGVHSALPSNSAYPTPSMIGDLDGDGRPEFAAGTQGAAGTPGQVYFWYADSLDTGITMGVQQATTGSFVEPPAATGTQQRIVQFAGDMTGDGNPDLVVGNWQANSLLGEVYLLY
jgi:hypothetical protein